MTSPATYVYCVVSSRQPLQPTHTNTVAGLPGAGAVRALEIKPGRFLIVSDVPLDEFAEGPLTAKLADLDWVSRAAVAHESVTESFMSADAVVPMKLFTLFTSDERALAAIRAGSKRIDGLIKRLGKQDEWGVRLVFDESLMPRPDSAAASASGRGYLMAKRQQQAISTKHATEMRTVAAGVIKTLRPMSSDVKKRAVTAPAEGRSRLLLDAAFLVPRAKSARFRKSIESRAKKIASSGYALQLTGPWPPYSFVEG